MPFRGWPLALQDHGLDREGRLGPCHHEAAQLPATISLPQAPFGILRLPERRLRRRTGLARSLPRRMVPGGRGIAVSGIGKAGNPHEGISNITEWAKKQACWARTRDMAIELPDEFIAELISLQEVAENERAGKKDWKILNGIEAQTAVVNAGRDFLVQSPCLGD